MASKCENGDFVYNEYSWLFLERDYMDKVDKGRNWDDGFGKESNSIKPRTYSLVPVTEKCGSLFGQETLIQAIDSGIRGGSFSRPKLLNKRTGRSST